MIIETRFDPGDTVFVREASGAIRRRRIWWIEICAKAGLDRPNPEPEVIYHVSARSPWRAYPVYAGRVFATEEEA